MKKNYTILFITLSLLIPALCVAGLVPCGNRYDDLDTDIHEDDPCTICHFFLMFKMVVLDFIVLKAVPLIAVLKFVIAGSKLLLAGGDPGAMVKIKTEITNTVLIIMLAFGAWVIVNTVLGVMEVADWTGLGEWWNIDCSTQ